MVGEFNRKLAAAQQAQRQELENFKNEVLQAVRGTASAAPVKSEPKTVSDYPTDQLETMLSNPQATPTQKAVIQAELTKRAADSAVDAKLGAYERTRTVKEESVKATREAIDTYPLLTDKTSAFHAAVDAELSRRRAMYGNFPTDILDAANVVARRMNVQPRTVASGFVAGGRSAPVETETQGPVIGDETYNRLASRLQDALPPGKTFDPKKIQERAQNYRNRGIL